MNVVKSLLYNSAFALLAELAEKSSNAVLFWIISRTYGAQEAGIYALAVSFLFVSSRLAFFGLEQILTRDVARQRDQVAIYFANLALLRLVLAATGVLVVWGALELMFDYSPHTQRVILLIGLISFAESITFLCRSVFSAFEQIKYQTWAGLLSGVLKTCAGIGALLLSTSLETLAIVLFVANLFSIGIYVYLVWARFLREQPRASIDPRFCWQQLKRALPFALISVSAILDTQLSPILLSWFCTEEQIGIYGAAATIVNLFNLFPQAFRVAIFPVMSRYFVQDANRVAGLYQKSLKFVLLLALPVALGGIVLADDIIGLLYSPEFAPAATVLPILLGSWLLLAVNVVDNRLLLAADKQRWSAITLTIGLAINLGGNLLWTSQFGIVGAAGARLIASVCILAGTLIGVRRYVCLLPPVMLWLKPVAAAAAMALLVLAFSRLVPTHLVWLIGLGLFSYPVALLLTRSLDRQDRQVLGNLWHQALQTIGFDPPFKRSKRL